MKRLLLRCSKVYGMAFPRDVATAHLEQHAENLCTEVIKATIYKDKHPTNMYHWVHDKIAAWLNHANKVKCDSKLKPRDYTATVFKWFGTDRNDANVALIRFMEFNTKYEKLEIDDDMIDSVFDSFKTLKQIALPVLSSKKCLSVNEWYQLIRPIFE